MTEAQLMEHFFKLAYHLATKQQAGTMAVDDLAQCGLLNLLQVSRRKSEGAYSPSWALLNGMREAYRQELGFRANTASRKGFTGHGIGSAIAAGGEHVSMEAAALTYECVDRMRLEARVELERLKNRAGVTARDWDILMRYSEDETQAALGTEYGMSKGRVSQICNQTIAALAEAANVERRKN